MLYGRDVERHAVGALLDAARESRSGVLVVRGEAGIGKSALLQDARDRAGDMHVLSVRGVESESELAFAGLHQLVLPAVDLLDRLPPPQALALQGALGLAERSGDDRFLISAACLTLLSELAERRPVLCLIDDAQWLDTPSADALVFVARRLDAEGVVMLFAAREADERRFEARDLPDLTLTGIDAAAAEELIRRRGARDVAPHVRELLVQQSAGNALALIELPTALTERQLAGDEPLPETLPLTRGVQRVYLDRVQRLSEATQRLLLLIAADDTGQLAPVLAAARGLGIGAEALGAAEQAGLVSVSGARVEVRHPLVRSAVYQGASSGERRAAHLALAGVLTEDRAADQRAWHLSAAALGPDAGVADELERTADRARLRGGHAAAASALERAAELSTGAGDVARRLTAAASAAWHAGQADRTTALLRRITPLDADVLQRAEADHLRGLIGLRRGNLLDAGAILITGAASVAEVDPHKAFEMLVDAGSVAGRSGDSPRMVEVAHMIGGLPRGKDAADPLLADLLVGVGSLIEGKEAVAAPLIIDAVAQATDSSDTRVLSWAATGASTVGDLAAEAALLRRALSVARQSGAVDELVLVLETFVSSASLSGRYDYDAEALEGLRLAREAGLANAACSFLAALAWTASVRGDEERCRAHAAEVSHALQSNALANAHTLAEWAVATLDLASGRPEDAITRLSELAAAPIGVLQPFFVLMFTPDLVEACVRSGRADDARAAFAVLDAFVQPQAPLWSLGGAARSRALLAEDAEIAEQEFRTAIETYALADRPLDRARVELLLGEHLRRRRHRVQSRQHLRAALETFERLGAEPWIERARGELRASGETARRRDPSTTAELTPQELQVARFVAQGLSNKEVAAQLFLSPRTIDAHLRNVFAKLGITSRTQLARIELDAA